MTPHPSRLMVANYPHVIDVPARFSDLDPQNHLNNVAIGNFYEEGRSAFLRVALEGVRRSGMTMRLMMANVSISYLREGRYPGVLRVGTGMSGIGRTSFRLAQVLVQETCIGIAESVTVHVVNGASAPLPDNLKAALAAFQVGDRIEDPTEKVLEAGTKARILIADNESDWMSAHSFRIGRRT